MGEAKHDGLAVPGHVVLAHEPPFRVGCLSVEPPTRQLRSASISETLEPRVMQVLVALFRADGRIVTRDELIEQCWEGRIVSEDAINRTIFRLRQVAATIGGGSFSIETITKVGYRLITARPSQLEIVRTEIASDAVSRRWLLGGAAAIAGAGAVGLAWRRPWQHRPKAEAVELVRLGDIAQRAGRPDQVRQAVAYYERAVRVDPQYAAAWGGLALSYTHGLDGFSEAQLASVPPRIRSAAARAKELDPDNVDADIALACVTPYFRNWGTMEANLRRIQEQHPEHWLASGRLAILYYQVGRMSEGAALHRAVIARDPMIPGPYAFAALALSSAGRIQEADGLLKEGSDRWPANPLIWNARFNHLLFSGRPGSAAALVQDPEARPSGMTDAHVQPYLTIARAAQSQDPSAVEAAISFATNIARNDTRAIADAAPILALFERDDLLRDILARYFLNRGPFGASSPLTPYTRRYTDFLYVPAMARFRGTGDYRELMRAIGLSAYWQSRAIDPSHLPN